MRPTTSRRAGGIALALVTVLLLGGALVFLSYGDPDTGGRAETSRRSAARPEPAATSVPTALITPTATPTRVIYGGSDEEILAIPTQELPRQLWAKRQMLEWERRSEASAAVVQATAIARGDYPPPIETPGPSGTEPPVPTGILPDEMGGAHFPARVALIRNSWQDWVDGKLVQVNAGQLTGDDPGRTLVIVRVYGADLIPRSERFYPAPWKAGAVKIVAVEGGVFTLRSETGERFTFDLGTKQWSAAP